MQHSYFMGLLQNECLYKILALTGRKPYPFEFLHFATTHEMPSGRDRTAEVSLSPGSCFGKDREGCYGTEAGSVKGIWDCFGGRRR